MKCSVGLNPFRMPLRQGLVNGGSVGFPWLSNGFVAGFINAHGQPDYPEAWRKPGGKNKKFSREIPPDPTREKAVETAAL